MEAQNTQQHVNLTDEEIVLFNEIFSNAEYYFSNYFHTDNGTDLVFCVFKKDEKINKRDDIVNLFGKFHGNNANDMRITTEGALLFAALCSISRDITHKFSNNINFYKQQLDKNDLFDLFKEMIDPSQHNQLLKKEKIKMLERKDQNGNVIESIKATETLPTPRQNPTQTQDESKEKAPNSCFNLSSIKEFFKKIINFISCGLLCNGKEKNKTN